MTQNGISNLVALQYETVWLDSNRCRDAERQFHEFQAQKNKKGLSNTDHHLDKQVNKATPISSLACEIANVREKIKNFLKNGDTKVSETDVSKNLLERIEDLEKEKAAINRTLSATVAKLDEISIKFHKMEAAMKSLNISIETETKSCKDAVLKNGPANAEDDEDVDLFGSDEETEEEAKLKMERLKAYENKKSKKPALVAKSSVVLDVKPWSDETDMKELEIAVRKIEADGLKWGAGKLVPLAYGIQKFQVVAVVEDDKVSIDWLQETIQEIEDLVQSVDIAAFNKL